MPAAMSVRTRFAPSPTGHLHIGGARTALFSWAYARRHGGAFVLRIEDTDTERSTQESAAEIVESLRWLGIEWDEGPYFQMQRLARYREAAEQLVARGHAYRCWTTKEELEALRAAQLAKGLKPRYDGRWRPERARAAGLVSPADRPPVIRFRTPEEGTVGWNDLVKGPVEFANAELDDLVLLRADGVPTYNFGAVVDDIDMGITHVIRGDDHVNNTPRQIHIFRALGAKLPDFAHLPMILGTDGERLSKRHGALSVLEYRAQGWLPEALANALARLGWSHGDDEIFDLGQFVAWFDLAHVSRSSAKFNPEKALWLNREYLRRADDARLARLAAPLLGEALAGGGPPLEKVVALVKARAATLVELADEARLFYQYTAPGAAALAERLNERTRPALRMLEARLGTVAWERSAIAAAIAEVLKASGLAMPELAMPVRLLVTGRAQTPPLDAVLELLGREKVLARLARYLEAD
jgi:glutamyl-tRNA synthetase